jgi:hypothetical protein
MLSPTVATLSAIAASSLKGRRPLAVVFASLAFLLAISSSASAYIPPTNISLNGWNWSGNAGYGSTPPAWYETTGSDGVDTVVHLQGAAKQFSGSNCVPVRPLPGCLNVNPWLIGTLPAAARPDRTVYTIVHTLGGTYADLAINPQGQIFVIGPRPPAVQDLSFVSLEGVSYIQFQPSPGAFEGAIHLNNSWSGNAGYGSTPPAAYVDYNESDTGPGVVHLAGAVTWTNPTSPWACSGCNVIGTLPASVPAPRSTAFTIVHTLGGTYADLAINPQGQIILIAPRSPAISDVGFVSLEGVTYSVNLLEFPPSQQASPILLNGSNWSAGGFGASGPSWWKDPDGIVHLTGGLTLKQSGSSLVGTLPPEASPFRTVYTIVHTFAGTYADLAITPGPQGQIFLIGPRPPAVQDYTFVSLEGITYQP